MPDMIDTNRFTDGVVLPQYIADEVWAKAIEQSAIMTLVNPVRLPGPGMAIQVITSDPEAEWVAETGKKPVSGSTFETKLMVPYKIAVIELVSKEFKRDLPGLYRELERRLPASIGKKFDETVFSGTAPGANFDVLTNVTDIAIGTGQDVYSQLIEAQEDVAIAGGDITGFAFAPQGMSTLMRARDNDGRPLFINSATAEGGFGTLLGAPVKKTNRVYSTGTPNTIGFAGDWSKARYGVVDGINFSISEETAIFDDEGNGISLWQNNLIAVRVEAELGFVVEDDAYFVKFTDEAAPEPEPGEE